MSQKASEKSHRKHAKNVQKTTENRCKNRPETTMTPTIDETRFVGPFLTPPFRPQVGFGSIFGSRPGLKIDPGTHPLLFKNFASFRVCLRSVSGAPREGPGPSGDALGTHFWTIFGRFWAQIFVSIFSIDAPIFTKELINNEMETFKP